METIHTELSCVLNESISTHYLIYKIINNINGKYYIGQHITQNIYDNYAGSGKIIVKAEHKYGLSAFTKYILFDFDNFEEMNKKEAELVQLSNCYPYDPMSYNLKLGGIQGRLTEESIKKCKESFRITWLNTPEEKKQAIRKNISEKTSGKNNPMYGYKWSKEQLKHLSEVRKGTNNFSSMTSEQHDIVCEKIRQSKIGDKNPMYGKNSEDYMTEEAIQQKREKIKQHQLNTRRMQNIAISPKVISVKLDQVNDYLKMGYTFFKYHFVLKKQIPSKYAKYHNMYFIEISRYLEDYFKLYGGQPIPNDMVYTISGRHKSEFILNDDKIHYQRYIKSNNQITCELLTLAFKDKTIIKNAILNKDKMFDIDRILIYDSRYKNNNNMEGKDVGFENEEG